MTDHFRPPTWQEQFAWCWWAPPFRDGGGGGDGGGGNGGGTTAGVTTFNTRSGDVTLTLGDVTGTGILNNTALAGTPTAPTPDTSDISNSIATTSWVNAAIAAAIGSGGDGGTPGVASFNGRYGAVTFTAGDLESVDGATHADLATATAGLATQSYVTSAISAATTDMATQSYVTSAISAATTDMATQTWVNSAISTALSGINVGVSSFNTRTGAITLTAADITATGYTPPAATPGPGQRVALASVTITNGNANTVANLIYTFTNAYDLYEIEGYNLCSTSPGGDNIYMRISTNGTTWISTNNYTFASSYNLTTYQSNTWIGTGNTPQQFITVGAFGDPGTKFGAYLLVKFANAWSTTRLKTFLFMSLASMDNTGNVPNSEVYRTDGMGAYVGGTQALMGIQFRGESGGVSTGTFTLYGIVKYS